MNRIKIILASLFVLTLASGLVAGLLVAKLPATNAVTAQRSALAETLQLNEKQESQVKAVWEEIGMNVDECYTRVQRMQMKRDERIFALLTDDQKLEYNKIQKETGTALADLKKDRDRMFVEAVEKTKSILNDVQKKKYAQMTATTMVSGRIASQRIGPLGFLILVVSCHAS